MPRNLIPYIIFALLSVLSYICAGASIKSSSFTRLGMRDGLAESHIRAVTALPDRRVAIATTATIDIFDGTKFTSIELPPEKSIILDNYEGARQLSCDASGRLWLKNDRKQLFIIDANTGKAIEPDSLLRELNLPSNPTNLYVAGDRIMITDRQNRLHISENGKPHTPIPLEKTPENILIYSDELVILYPSGKTDLLKKDGTTTEIIPKAASGSVMGPKGHIVYNKLFTTYNINDSSILFTIDLKTLKQIRRDSIPSHITDFIPASDSIIIATPSGIAIFKNGLLHRTEITEQLTGLTRDNTGALWLATQGNGILYDNSSRTEYFSVANSPYPTKATPTYVDNTTKAVAEKIAKGITNSSLIATDGHLWLCTRKGLIVTDTIGNIIFRINQTNGLSNENVQSICRDKNGDYWIACANTISRIHPLSQDSLALTNFNELDGISLDGKEFRQSRMMMDSAGIIHVAYAEGTCSFNPDSIPTDRYTYICTPAITESQSQNIIWWTIVILIILITTALIWHTARSNHTVENPYREALLATGTTSLPEPSAIKTESPEHAFIEKLRLTVEENLEREDLNVTTLSKLMAMDRTVLYRRMMTVSGMTPSAYIKAARMNVAKRLLKETELSISEISLKLGFSSSKYFSKVFKATFGLSPASFRNDSEE